MLFFLLLEGLKKSDLKGLKDLTIYISREKMEASKINKDILNMIMYNMDFEDKKNILLLCKESYNTFHDDYINECRKANAKKFFTTLKLPFRNETHFYNDEGEYTHSKIRLRVVGSKRFIIDTSKF
jgi:hypothetical protein